MTAALVPWGGGGTRGVLAASESRLSLFKDGARLRLTRSLGAPCSCGYVAVEKPKAICFLEQEPGKNQSNDWRLKWIWRAR